MKMSFKLIQSQRSVGAITPKANQTAADAYGVCDGYDLLNKFNVQSKVENTQKLYPAHG